MVTPWVKLMCMEKAELERMEHSARLRLMTTDQRAARQREFANMRRIEADRHRPVYREGLEEAREALRMALQ